MNGSPPALRVSLGAMRPGVPARLVRPRRRPGRQSSQQCPWGSRYMYNGCYELRCRRGDKKMGRFCCTIVGDRISCRSKSWHFVAPPFRKYLF